MYHSLLACVRKLNSKREQRACASAPRKRSILPMQPMRWTAPFGAFKCYCLHAHDRCMISHDSRAFSYADSTLCIVYTHTHDTGSYRYHNTLTHFNVNAIIISSPPPNRLSAYNDIAGLPCIPSIRPRFFFLKCAKKYGCGQIRHSVTLKNQMSSLAFLAALICLIFGLQPQARNSKFV